jgi:hypothetical protein
LQHACACSDQRAVHPATLQLYYVLTGIAVFAASPLLLCLSYVSSAFAVDLDIVFAPLEKYAAKEVFFLVRAPYIDYRGSLAPC